MWHSGLRICVVTAASWIRSLARELLHAVGTAKKKKKKEEEEGCSTENEDTEKELRLGESSRQ